MDRKIATNSMIVGCAFVAIMMTGIAAGCSEYRAAGRDAGAGQQPEAKTIEELADHALQRFEQRDPTLASMLGEAHAYAIFPEVTKGGAGIGGARGEGVAYEQDELVGYATLRQGTIGAQLGGQVYSQLILFEDEWAMDNFKRGELEFAAQASAVAAAEGAAANADYDHGVAIFTLPRTGLMFEASSGGQPYTFEPIVDD